MTAAAEQYQNYVAFFDDSGSAHPADRSEHFTLGMVVIPFEKVKSAAHKWWTLIKAHTGVKELPPIRQLECKSSDLYDYYSRLNSGAEPRPEHQVWVDLGMGIKETQALIMDVWDFLANGKTVTYLAAIVHKAENWERFKRTEWNAYKALKTVKQPGAKAKTKALEQTLEYDCQWKAFEWLLQRLQYLMEEKGMQSRCILIGDEAKYAQGLYAVQAFVAAGFKRYTEAPSIVNNVAFGSSLHNPCLQMADWVAYAVRQWALGNPYVTPRFKTLLPLFRGADRGRILGEGIVTIPGADLYPPLP